MGYDVFLSHNNKDKLAVEQIGHLLTQTYGLTCWLDKWNLVPGEPWQEALETALDQCQTVAVFVGPYTISPWENEEMRSALEARVSNREKRVIPVLLPGAPDSEDLKLPRFLSRLTWVDFRGGLKDKNALYRLYCGIQGIKPGAGAREEDNKSKRLSVSPKVTTYFWRILRKRHIWLPAIAIVVLIISILGLSGNLNYDFPLFCGKKFSSAPGYINLATEQRNDSKYACAIRNLQKGLTVNATPSEQSNIYYTLASIFIVKQEPVKALDYADRGLEVDAAYQDLLHVSKGIAHCQMKQNAEALQEFSIFLELNPDPTDLLADNVRGILNDLKRGEDMSDVCWVKLGAESLP